jgi:hypothetical protein
MDSKQLEILTYLRERGVGVTQDIAPILQPFYTHIKEDDNDSVGKCSTEILRLLLDMEAEGFIKHLSASL